ncbi:hypothetical protein, partial [uncultured Thiodictyon sp.]|uniref:hypothetical protein n=1 Tax=uncultured Thiodictyon sp. TaxID=1846217 RepID=UPI0025D8996B
MKAIAKLGGIGRAEARSQGIDPAAFKQQGFGGVFTKDGDSFDGLAGRLDQYGYPVRNAEGRYDSSVLLDAVQAAMRGERIISHHGAEAQGARLEAERVAQEAAAAAPAIRAAWNAMQAPQRQAWAKRAGLRGGTHRRPGEALRAHELERLHTAPDQAPVAAAPTQQSTAEQIAAATDALAQSVAAGANRRVAEHLAAGRSVTYTKPEAVAAARANRDYYVLDHPDGSVSVLGVRHPDTGQWVGAHPPSQGEDFTLTPETLADLARMEQERRAADRAERQAKARDATDAQQGDFNLTGSDRPADELAARGRQSLFDAQSPDGKEQASKSEDDVELDRRGQTVAKYAGAVLSGAAVPPKLLMGRIGKDAAEQLSRKTGLTIDRAIEVVVASNIVHAQKGHPDMTSNDWARLPFVTNRFDDAAPGRVEGDPRTPRIIVRRMESNGTGYGAVLAFASGSRGERLNVVTYFKGTAKGLDAWWEANKGLARAGVPDSTGPASSAASNQTKPSEQSVDHEGRQGKDTGRVAHGKSVLARRGWPSPPTAGIFGHAQVVEHQADVACQALDGGGDGVAG